MHTSRLLDRIRNYIRYDMGRMYMQAECQPCVDAAETTVAQTVHSRHILMAN